LHQQGGRCWTGWGARWAPPPLCPRPAWSAASQTAAWDRRHEAWRSRSAPQRATPHDWRWQASHHHGHHPPPRPRLWASEISAKARRRRGGRAVTVGKGAGQVDPRRRKLLHLYGPLTSHNTASARERKGRCIGPHRVAPSAGCGQAWPGRPCQSAARGGAHPGRLRAPPRLSALPCVRVFLTQPPSARTDPRAAAS
jgi:hypothetical protein